MSYRVSMPIVQRNLDLLDTVNAILTQEGMDPLEPQQLTSGSDAADVTAVGIPCLDSLGPRGGNVHSKDEYAILTSMAEAARRIAVIIFNL